MKNDDPKASEVLSSIEKKLGSLIIKIEEVKEKLLDFSTKSTDNQKIT